MSGRQWAALVGIAAVVGVLAVASYVTTSYHWDGGFPAGMFRVDVRDAAGNPVRGAVLRVYRRGTRELASGYPLDDHTAGRDLVSDDAGRIVALRRRGGLQFGGHGWHLFWVFPMGKVTAPEFDCEVTAEGFRPLAFSVDRLFQSPPPGGGGSPVAKLERDGVQVEVPVHELAVTLQR